MIVNHDLKFVFVAVPKTATTTIHNYFGIADSRHPYLQEKYHYPLSKILEENPEFSSYYKFGFSRNPWDRMVSSWIEFTTERDHLDTWSAQLPNDFVDFEDFILNFSKTKWSEEIHFHPSHYYLSGCDFVGKYENLNKDFNKVLEHLSYQLIDTDKLPKMRSTQRDSYQRYYTNKNMIDSVASFFEDDIKHYGYSF